MEFKDYLYLIKKRWHIFIIVMFIVFAIHHLYVNQQEPVYEGTARVIVSGDAYGPAMPAGIDYPYNTPQYLGWYKVNTNKMSIMSLQVLGNAAVLLIGDELKNAASAKNEKPAPAVEDDLKNNPTSKWIVKYKDYPYFVKFRKTNLFLNMKSNALHEAEDIVKAEKEASGITGAPASTDPDQKAREILIKSITHLLRSSVSLGGDEDENKMPNEIVNVSFQNPDDRVVVAIPNAVAFAAMEYHRRERDDRIADTIKALEADQALAKSQFETMKKKNFTTIKEYREKSQQGQSEGIPWQFGKGYAEMQTLLAQQVMSLEEQKRGLENQSLRLKEEQDSKRGELLPDSIAYKKFDKDLQSGTYSTPQIDRLRGDTGSLEATLESLRNGPPKRTDVHPSVAPLLQKKKKLDEELAAALAAETDRRANRINEEVQNLDTELRIVEKQTEDLAALISGKVGEIRRLNDLDLMFQQTEFDTERMSKKVIRLEEWKDTLALRQESLKSSKSAIEIYEACSSPRMLPKKGEKFQDYILTAILALIAAIFLIYFMEYIDTRITTEYDVRRHMNLPVISVIPECKAPEVLLTTASPTSLVSERFNTTGTVLRTMMQEKGHKTVLVCSAKPQEGKTSVSVNLAIALSRKGINTVLVDTDMRKPRVHTVLNLPNAVGLSTLLEGKFEVKQIVDNILGESQEEAYNLRDYLLPTEFPNLRVLPSGPIPANPVEFLESNNMRLIIERLKHESEIIIFDSPPMNSVGDGLALASVLDTSLIVVGSRKVEQQEATWMKHLLSSTQASIAGVILNRSHELGKSEYYYYYSYKEGKKVRRTV
jgi:Mrp family chromosome partitioning ATPase